MAATFLSLHFFQIFHGDAGGAEGVLFTQISVHLTDLFFGTEETAFDTPIDTVILTDDNIVFPGKAHRAAVDDQFFLSHNTVLISFPQVTSAV